MNQCDGATSWVNNKQHLLLQKVPPIPKHNCAYVGKELYQLNAIPPP